MGGFVPDCHTQTFVEVAKLELKMDNKFRRPRVSGWEEDGRFISVEYMQENGERVKGVFERIGWANRYSIWLAIVQSIPKEGPCTLLFDGWTSFCKIRGGSTVRVKYPENQPLPLCLVQFTTKL